MPAKKKTAAKKKAVVKKKVAVAKATVTKKKVAAKKSAAAKKTTAKKTAVKNKAPSKKGKATANDKTLIGSFGFTPYETSKREEYMSEQQVMHFRSILEAWKTSLMEEVDRTMHHMQDDAANFPDPNDRASQESEFSLELRTRDRERKLIKKINKTIDLLDAGDYGWCNSCGVEIGVRRLEARPTADLCVDCKTLEEIREKQMA